MEHFVQAGLQREEGVVRASCLTMLGHVRRVQRRFAEAERYWREAVALGKNGKACGRWCQPGWRWVKLIATRVA